MKWTNFRGTDMRGGHESTAEVDLYLTFQKAKMEGVLPGFRTGQRIVLLDTEPDFAFLDQKLLVYVDGPPHDKAKRGAKDDLQNDYLTRLGWKVMRVHYDGRPMSKAKQAVVLGWLKDVLQDGSSRKLYEFDLEDGPIL